MKARYRKGQIGVVLTLIMPVLVAAMALGSDVAVLYFNWMEMQKAVDAAVLAGANFLPISPGTAQSTATTYAEINGIKSSEITSVVVTDSNIQVSMAATRNVPYFFARVLGLDTATVTVTATAGLQASASALGSPNLLPLGIQCPEQNCQPGQTYRFAPPLVAPVLGAGSWIPLSFSNHEGQLMSQLLNGYQGFVGNVPMPVSVGESIATALGDANYMNDTGTALNSRISTGVFANPQATALVHPPVDPRLIEVPVVSFNPVNVLGKSVPITGLAQLWITTGSWNSGIITATLVTGVAANNVPNVTAANYGTYTPVLIK